MTSLMLFRSWLVVCVLALGHATTSLAGDAKQISGLDLNGARIDPLQVAAGKMTVFVFVRTDCPLSNRYAPYIKQLNSEHGANASFWLIYPGKAVAADEIIKHRQAFGYSIPALRDPSRGLVGVSQVSVTPEAAVFDRAGKLVYHGEIDNRFEAFGRARSTPTTHELADALTAALRGEQPKISATHAVGCFISDVE